MCQLISVVIPCFHSELYLERTVSDIREAFLSRQDVSYQIILVDDGSQDGTYDVIRTICSRDPHILGIHLSRNFGQSRARMAAIPHICGDCAVFMDDDGQHPASGIFRLVQKLSEGYDLVYAQFPFPKKTLFRRAASALVNRLLSATAKKPPDIKITSFFALSKFSLGTLSHYRTPYVFLGGYLFEVTSRIGAVTLQQLPRRDGKSRYTLKKLYAMWLDNMLAFPSAPSRFSTAAGGAAFLLVLLFAILSIITGASMYVLLTALFLCFGTLFFLLGFLGEAILRTLCTLQQLPMYEIRETTADDKH